MSKARSRQLARVGALLVGLSVPVGLVSSVAAETAPAAAGRAEGDPIEGVNRKIFWFNDTLDVWVLEPVARGWKRITPSRVRRSVANFFENVRTPIIAVNDLLQWKPVASASDVGRFGVNTTVGILGLFDPASGWGLEKHDEDFGQTLGVWRVPPGPFLTLPLLGPSNVRDTVALVVDSALTVYPFFIEGLYVLVPTGARGVDTVNFRSGILNEVEDAKKSSLDYYAFVRNAYAQRRDALVHDRTDVSAEDQQDLYHPDFDGTP
jgi:phospholipid-binding lipoprotein MlaA